MKVHASWPIYRGRVIDLRVDEIDARDGGTRLVEVAKHNGGVVVVAQPEPASIVLVRQYRHAVGASLWEVPAGILEPDEDPADAAKRELREETGYLARTVRYLWSAYSTPGFCDELLRFYVAEGLERGEQALDEHEQIEVRTFSLEEAWRFVEADELRDAKSQIALGWARRQFDRASELS